MDGKSSRNQRDENVRRFRTDKKVRVFLMTLMANCAGLTLPEATDIVYLDFSWNISDHLQADKRACSLQDPNKVVHIHYLMLKDSIESHILRVLFRKLYVLHTIMGKTKEQSQRSFIRQAKPFEIRIPSM
jgi:SNF2 family DNA or RNA helicase